MITLLKAEATGALSNVVGNPVISSNNEDLPRTELLQSGKFVEKALQDWEKKYTQIRITKKVIMPDHIHLCLHVHEYLKVGLSRAISNLMGRASRIRHDSIPEHLRPDKMQPFFRKGFNDRIAFNDRQWIRQQKYIEDNPRRLLIKRKHPYLFFKKWLITMSSGMQFMAKGNIMLLKNPDIQVVRFSRKFSEEHYQSLVKSWEACIDNSGVLVSPFIHPNEKDVRDKAFEDGGSIIRICENGFGDRFAPVGREFDYAGTSRLLLIAPLRHDTRASDLSRQKAMEMNAIAEAVAQEDWLTEKAKIREFKD